MALAAATLLALAGCGGEDSGKLPGAAAAGARETRCRIGKEPNYFVPRPPDSPLAIIGCARLTVSGKPVELSANANRRQPRIGLVRGIGPLLCINPAYGKLGAYIPTACPSNPVREKLYVVPEIPRQLVRGYELVIWGVMRGAGGGVTTRFAGGKADAAVFGVDGKLARKVGAKRSFSVFIVELPSGAGCEAITVEAKGRAYRATDRIRPKRALCPAAERL